MAQPADPSSSTHPAKKSKHAGKSSKSKPSTSRPQHKQHPRSSTTAASQSSGSASAPPGVQKLKAALRQTRRLLAKDKLAADVRVQTERRLRSLEADLARAEVARTERTMAVRYHHVKFFERRKVERRIGKVKRRIAELEEEEEGLGEEREGKDAKRAKKERKKAEKELKELRVDLNYVLHYPKTRKYISLFPPDVRGKGSKAEDEDDDDEGRRGGEATSETDRQREEIRSEIRRRMDAGELSWEPEVELAKGEKRVKAAKAGSGAVQADSGKKDENAEEGMGKGGVGVADDDFFAMDDGDEGEESEGEGEDEADVDMDED